MSKLETLSPINASYTGISKLNSHLEKIAAAFQNTLSRDGSTPNHMDADIDMNDNQLINLAEPMLDGNAATKRYVDALLAGETAFVIATGSLGAGWGGSLVRPSKDTVSLSVKDHGAVGDGVTNDTAAFTAASTAAAAAKQMLYIPGGTYVVSDWTPAAGLYVFGAGEANTILLRRPSAPSNAAVINLTQGNVVLENFTVDGNKANNTLASQGIAVTAGGAYTMRNLTVRNAKAVSGGFGAGIAMSVTNDQISLTQSVIENCALTACDTHGVTVDECWYIRIDGCRATGNLGSGISVDNFDTPIEVQSQRHISIVNNLCIDNTGNGIQIVGTTVTNILPVPGNQQALNVIVQGNNCIANGSYGIAAQGAAISCVGNQCFYNGDADPSAAGILFNCYQSICAENICTANIWFGIDAGGSAECSIRGNLCSFNGSAVAVPSGLGINLGACVNVNCSGNTLINNGSLGAATGIQIYCPAYDFGGPDAGMAYRTNSVLISDNVITLTAATQVGIEIRQGGNNIAVRDNIIRGGVANNAILLMTNSVDCANNLFSGSIGGVSLASAATLVVPDWADTVAITGTTAITDGINTFSQSTYFQKVAWIEVTNGGAGYTSNPTVSITGGGGAGATANAYVGSEGTVTGVLLSNYGSGYTGTPTVSFSGGGGAGAVAVAQVGVPNRIGRKMTLIFGGASSLAHAGNVFLSGARTFFASASGSDTLSLIGMYGSNWQETGRQSATSESYSNVETAANIAAIGSTINTRGKYAGRSVYDTTNLRLMVANGPAAGDRWYLADGSLSVLPS